MDAVAARLTKLSGKDRRHQNSANGRKRAQKQTAQPLTPSSGLRTPVSGIQTPTNGSASRTSALSTPREASDYGSDDDEEEEEVARQPFRFLDLPYELRRKILLSVMRYNDVVDLNVNAVRRLGLMLVSRQWYNECCETFYGGNMFRLLPLDGKLDKKRTKPMIQHFTPRNRGFVTRLELRLGPHWSSPPRCWQITDALGLEDLASVRRLDVFVQTDPEHPSFVGFRKSKDFYTNFCGVMLEEICRRMPNLETISLDAWPSVGRDSPLVRRLEAEVTLAGKKVLWGPNLRLDDCYEAVFPGDVPSVYDTVHLRDMTMITQRLSQM